MTRRLRLAAALALALTMLASGVASAHPDHAGGSGAELFPGEGIVADKNHDSVGGHLPERNENVTVVGRGSVSAPEGTDGDLTGRVADVAAFENHAYLTAFIGADCLGGGAWVMDISDPTDPTEVDFLPTTPGSYAGEGAQVFVPDYGDHAGTPLFIHQNETCDPTLTEDPTQVGGINIWDVSAPEDAEQLVAHAGDLSEEVIDEEGTTIERANTVHSMFAWNSPVDEKSYVVLVDNEEATDVDIMDITDPTNPIMVNDTLDLVDRFGVEQESPDNLTQVFSHDMMVYVIGDRIVMSMNYWDGGYVLLDVTDPSPGRVSLIAESDFAELDEERLARGQEITPEGNAHQNELSPGFDFMIGTDEDFAPFRSVASITSGPFADTPFEALPGGDAGQIPSDAPLTGAPTPVGLACLADGPLEAADGGVALIERGACAFQEKLDSVVAAGYDAGIVFGSPVEGCDSLINMLAVGEIPFLYVGRSTGLQILGAELEADPCAQATPATPGEIAEVDIASVFDGWGYVRLFGTDIPEQVGAVGSIEQIDTYAVEEAQDEDFAIGFGDLSIHEVAMDPDPDSGLAYLSYYAAGLRVVSYGPEGIQEVGAFIDEDGNNLWGVEVHQHPDGQQYVLASDRDFGLYIFQYQAPGLGPVEDNVDRAIAWSMEAVPAPAQGQDGEQVVLLGRDDLFADSLASGGAQGVLQAPLLLTGSEGLDDRVAAELERLQADRVILLGGTEALSEQVATDLTDLGVEVERVQGETRLETAVAVADRIAGADPTTAVLARAYAAGEDTQAFADALAAGALAAERTAPLLLTETDTLSEPTAEWLTGAGVEEVLLAGGADAISNEVQAELVELGITVTRLDGASRAATAVSIATERGAATAAAADSSILIDGASADAWADAFPATLLASQSLTPIVLVSGDVVPPETEGYLTGGGTPLLCGTLTTDVACDAAQALLGAEG